MYLVTCHRASLGNTEFLSYWCGGKQWQGNTKVPDAEMTPELLKALQDDKKIGANRIEVEHIDLEVKAPKK